MTIRDISEVMRLDYEFTRRLLHELDDKWVIQKVDNKYNIKDFLNLFFNQGKAPIEETLTGGVLTTKEAHKIVLKHVSCHLKTTLRKTRTGEIPAYKIKSTYRIPKIALEQRLAANAIPFRNMER